MADSSLLFLPGELQEKVVQNVARGFITDLAAVKLTCKQLKEEAYLTRKRESDEHYRAILAMYKVQTIALEAKHAEEIEVCRIEAKL
ncbi:hypothetical protein Bca52824_026825 [Brassica carinata]|uniref:F-box domain-containing protein n=1 Tax=Brassica carinata TaxID=52824 RepID=A0A8X7SJ85_BRACI|nr:hypothetical protein Bca52824_026825 [Brassica carinata]